MVAEVAEAPYLTYYDPIGISIYIQILAREIQSLTQGNLPNNSATQPDFWRMAL
jgi:hypothetical protein